MIVHTFRIGLVLGVVHCIQLCICAETDSPQSSALKDAIPLPTNPTAAQTTSKEDDLQKDQNRMNYFAFEACKFIFPSSGKDNLATTVWSPFSVYSTLAPLYQGAGGSTLEELKNVMHIRGDDDLQIKLNEDAEDVTSFKSFTGMFMSSDVHLDPAYQERVANSQLNKNKWVQTEIDDTMDFSQSLTLSTNYINSIMKDATGGMIPKMISPSALSHDTKMVIANGVQFKGKWKNQFESKFTKSAPFHGLKELTDVDMMSQKGTFRYGEFKEFNSSVCELEYHDSSMVLQIILPNSGMPLTSVWSTLKSREKLNEISQKLEPKEMEIDIPKLKVESEVPIQDTLTKMGLQTLFIPQSNLSGMILKIKDKRENLYVSKMIHKSVFEMDEEGTKAASSTVGILIPLSGFITQPDVFRVDSPFIFILKDSKTETVIFMGCVTDIANGQKEIPDRTNLITSEAKEQDDSISTPNRSQFQEEEKESTPVSISTVSTQSPVQSTQVEEDKWWIYSGDPEYLTNSQNIPATSADPELIIITPKYQQPEPKNPNAIRFPFPRTVTAQRQQHDNGSTPLLSEQESKDKNIS